MKKAFTLIELLFAMIIVALIFTTVPKIIYISNKSLENVFKEDGIFNMMSKVRDVTINAWDENNTNNDDILFTNRNNTLECNSSTDLRIGGFYSSRSCPNNLYASIIKLDENNIDEADDIDDFNNTEENTSTQKYTVFTIVKYLDDNFSYNYNNQSLNFTFPSTSNDSYTNIKSVKVILQDNTLDKNISSFEYYGANIGYITINSRQW